MSLRFIPVNKGSQLAHHVSCLMETVFPSEELVSYELLLDYAQRDGVRFDAIADGVELVGLSYCIDFKGAIYLFYLAVNPDMQSKGYGTRILDELRKSCDGKPVVLEAESVDVDAENIGQRLRRSSFYLKNGFEKLPYHIEEDGVIYDTYSSGSLPDDFDVEAYLGEFKDRFPEIADAMQLVEISGTDAKA